MSVNVKTVSQAEPTTSPKSEPPITSFTLKVSAKDAARFFAMSKAINERLPEVSPDTGDTCEFSLHAQLYEATQKCPDELVKGFLDRMIAFLIPVKEIKAGLVLLHDANMNDKLLHVAEALSPSATTSGLDKGQLTSLFRSLLTAISCCIDQSTEAVDLEDTPMEDKPQGLEPPPKKTKLDIKIVEESDQEFRPCQSPSFDCSLATLRDEDDTATNTVRREIDEISSFAAGEVLSDGVERATFDLLRSWYDEKGKSVVPWLELLDATKWMSTEPPSPPCRKTAECDPSMETHQALRDDILQVDENERSVSSGSRDIRCSVEEELPVPPTAAHSQIDSLSDGDGSRILVSFDFSGTGHTTPLCINVSENNIVALRQLVHRTGIVHCQAVEMCRRLLHMASQRQEGNETILALHCHDFSRSIDQLWSPEVLKNISKEERESFTLSLTSILSCYQETKPSLSSEEVDLQEFAVGFCFFCAGNKSAKLATGFEMLDDTRHGYLTEQQLLRYLSSYLMMLSAISLLHPLSKGHHSNKLTPQRRKAMRTAVDNGAKWTIGHFLKHMHDREGGEHPNAYSFESFALWYSVGGYNVAPWLELLDLNKLFVLIAPDVESSLHTKSSASMAHTSGGRRPAGQRDRMSTLRRHHSRRNPGTHPEVLFTFPLARSRSLVVLKEDARYVRDVVQELGLLSFSPDFVWSSLSKIVARPSTPTEGYGVDMQTFVQCMIDVCNKSSRKRSASGAESTMEELLCNFYQCFNLDQKKLVAVDELMGGLTLLCGGKKSVKLAFAFGIFDTRPGVHGKSAESVVHSLDGHDLFVFLRSILIVAFSCCRQSLDMDDSVVGQCISDTANMLCNDVMTHQGKQRFCDRLNFDEFGLWYNEGGFERAPWLELLDLKKWVLADNFDATLEKRVVESQLQVIPVSIATDSSIPPPPPEDALDGSFFEENGIMAMDSMDEMDMILMQSSTDRESDQRSPAYGPLPESSSHSPGSKLCSPDPRGNPLKFHLLTNEEQGGYNVSLSHIRITHLKSVLEDNCLHGLDCENVCNAILNKATKKNKAISKKGFDAAVASVMGSQRGRPETQQVLSNLLSGIFDAFDRLGSGTPSAVEIACGFTVLCHGKKSDKLEFAFEVLDTKKKGKLSRSDILTYLRSFLTVLMSIAFSPALKKDIRDDKISTMKGFGCNQTTAAVKHAVNAGAEWAVTAAFDGKREGDMSAMSFNEFADWYTTVGYSSIPWLELLDLQKWVFTNDAT